MDRGRERRHLYGRAVTRIYNEVHETEVDGDYDDMPDTQSVYGYVWWGSATQVTIAHDSDYYDSNNVIWNSSFTYDPAGRLTKAHIEGAGNDADARTRDLAFINDANGLILQRDETDYTSSTSGNPRELHYYFNGIRVGDISNDGISNTDYAAGASANNAVASASYADTIRTRNGYTAYGAFRGGGNTPQPYADFDRAMTRSTACPTRARRAAIPYRPATPSQPSRRPSGATPATGI